MYIYRYIFARLFGVLHRNLDLQALGYKVGYPLSRRRDTCQALEAYKLSVRAVLAYPRSDFAKQGRQEARQATRKGNPQDNTQDVPSAPGDESDDG